MIVAFDHQNISGIDDFHKLLTAGRVGVKTRLTII